MEIKNKKKILKIRIKRETTEIKKMRKIEEKLKNDKKLIL